MAFNQLKKWVGTQLWSTFMTEYNENIDELNTHLADYASMPEIITGSGGIAIKFPSGLMICTGGKNYTYSELVVDGVVSFEVVFPQPFVTNPESIIDSLRVGNSLRARGYTGNVIASTNTGFTYDIALDADVNRSGGSIKYAAIGFWK